MKKLITLIMCAVLLGATALVQGCAGTPKRIAYKTLRAVGESVDVAMRGYAEAAVSGLVDEPTQEKVAKLHETYRRAFEKAVIASQFDYETSSPAEVTTLALDLTGYIASFIH